MKAYQERVVAEKRELDERGDKLEQFILSDKFVSLPSEEQERMRRQLEIMGKYSEVLCERIAAFESRNHDEESKAKNCSECGHVVGANQSCKQCNKAKMANHLIEEYQRKNCEECGWMFPCDCPN